MELVTILPVNNKVPRIGLTYHSKVPMEQQPLVSSSHLAYKLFMENWDRNTIDLYEQSMVLLLTAGKRAHGLMMLATGGLTNTTMDIRLIFTAALKTRAHGILVAHNHPTHSLKPSQTDINITNCLVAAGNILKIQVIDHLIVTPNAYYSFADEGML